MSKNKNQEKAEQIKKEWELRLAKQNGNKDKGIITGSKEWEKRLKDKNAVFGSKEINYQMEQVLEKENEALRNKGFLSKMLLKAESAAEDARLAAAYMKDKPIQDIKDLIAYKNKERELKSAFSDDNLFVYKRKDLIDNYVDKWTGELSSAPKEGFEKMVENQKNKTIKKIKRDSNKNWSELTPLERYDSSLLKAFEYRFSDENIAKTGKEEAKRLKEYEIQAKRINKNRVRSNELRQKHGKPIKEFTEVTAKDLENAAKEKLKGTFENTAKNATENAAKGEAKNASKNLAKKVLTKGNIAAGVGLALGGYLVLNMFDKKGQQSNAQLYGQQGY